MRYDSQQSSRSTTSGPPDAPISNERTVEARTDTPIVESTYTETGEFHLVSVDPG